MGVSNFVITRWIKSISLLALVVSSAYGQGSNFDGTSVRLSDSPNDRNYVIKYSYDVNGRIEYIGRASRTQPEYSWTVSSGRLVSIVVVSNTATITTSATHGLTIGNKVTIAGVTGDTDLNGTYYVQTTPTDTTFTVTVASVTAATYSNSAAAVRTTAARVSDSCWFIEKFLYDGSGNLTDRQTSEFNQIFTNRAVTTGDNKITYQ